MYLCDFLKCIPRWENCPIFPGELTGLARGCGFCLLTPNSVKDIHPYQHGVGMSQTNGVGGIMEPGGWSENK